MTNPISSSSSASLTPERLHIRELEFGKRAVAFLTESNLIEEIDEIDYNLPENQGKDGYYQAFREAYQLGLDKKPLTANDICRWQGLITQESLKYGHDIPKQGIGRLRGADCPYDVQVAERRGTPYMIVHETMDRFLEELNQRLQNPNLAKGHDYYVIDTMAWAFFTFEHIHPFIDGNGRSGRLLFPYISGFINCAVPHVSFADVETFYDAHSTIQKMRQFVNSIFKESVIVDGEIYASIPGEKITTSGVYANDKGDQLILEWHKLERAMRAPIRN